MPKQTKSSKAWLQEHFTDAFVKQARQMGYRSRAAFKLDEMNNRDCLFKEGDKVVDLGAAPGSWSQVAVRKVGDRGKVIAVDKLSMAAIPNVTVIQGDFLEQETLNKINAVLGGMAVDIVISDMAPNISGVGITDHVTCLRLCESALEFATGHLKPGGVILVKALQGAGFEGFLRAVRTRFEKVLIRKPSASRGRSAETYVVGKGLKPRSNAR
jgi:23S rRNA (uridine2552-2'-O)-methyltransferase